MFVELMVALLIGLSPAVEFKEDFSGKQLLSWETLSGSWKTQGGELLGSSSGGDGLIFFKGGVLKNFSLECKIKVENREGSLVFRALDRNNLYLLVLNPKIGEEAQGSVLLLRRVNGKETYFAGCEQYFPKNEQVKLKVVCEGSKIDVYVNDKFTLSAEDKTFTSGFTGFRVFGDIFNGARASFQEFSVRELEVKK